ncbi:MAG: cysteine desulfurase family protein [Candidatus Pacearchaeota archaeon]
MKEVYLDNAATTRVDSRVIEEVRKCMSINYGNASSIHKKGENAKELLEYSRKIIASSINALPEEIYFTSGGTESNNLAIKGLALKVYLGDRNKNHIITTKIEHDSVINVCESLKKFGFQITYLNVDKEGFIDYKELEESITPNTLLVSIIHGNNEIGTIQDIQQIGDICRKKSVLFHIDACQSFTKTLIDVKRQNIDLISLNAHKIHGPKGVGALFIKNGIKINPLFDGGGQERGLRSGTENIPAIVGFAKAVQISSSHEISKISKLRDKLIAGLEKIPGSKLNGPKGERRLCNNVNFIFKGVEGESIVGYLSEMGIYASTGSACSSKSLKASHVLLSIGVKQEEAHGSLRLSLSKFTTEEEIRYAISSITKVIKRLRDISP